MTANMVAIPYMAAKTLSSIAQAISALYGMGGALNDYLDRHIDEMKHSGNSTISRTGNVLEATKFGFGVGYLSPVVVIAAGQYLLGNTLGAIATVATAATATNPVAMTCAAVGALYYGWGALSDTERNTILENLSRGLEIGVEFIKAIVRFVIETTKNLLSAENFEEIKGYITSAAKIFGKTLGDITHSISDVVSDTFETLRRKSGEAVGSTIDLASTAYTTAKVTAGKVADGSKETIGKISSNIPKVRSKQQDK